MAKNLQDLEEPIEKVLEKEFNRERLSSLTEEQINKWREWINWHSKGVHAHGYASLPSVLQVLVESGQ